MVVAQRLAAMCGRTGRARQLAPEAGRTRCGQPTCRVAAVLSPQDPDKCSRALAGCLLEMRAYDACMNRHANDAHGGTRTAPLPASTQSLPASAVACRRSLAVNGVPGALRPRRFVKKKPLIFYRVQDEYRRDGEGEGAEE